jgi:hypothetical protein
MCTAKPDEIKMLKAEIKSWKLCNFELSAVHCGLIVFDIIKSQI